MREQWRQTVHARGLARVPLALTGAAFAGAVLLGVKSGSIGPVFLVCALHALAVASGVLGRGADGARFGVAGAPTRGESVAGRLLGVLTLSSIFSVAVVVPVALVLRTQTEESIPRMVVTGVSSFLWMAALVSVLSTFLPRGVDAVAALLVWVGAAAANARRTRLGAPWLADAIQAAWENVDGAVVISDSFTAAAVADVARWGANMALAGLTAAILLHRSHGAAAALPRRLLLAVAGVLLVRLLVPSVHDRVAWVPAAVAPEKIAASRRPALYNFTAEWCGYCQSLDRDLFADAQSAGWLAERFVPVRVVDREREDGRNSEEVERLKARFDVGGFPTLVVVAPDGTVLARHEGYSGNLREVRRVLATALPGAPRQ